MSDDQPSLKERYTRAISAPRLVLAAERSGDVELLIAAGWIQDGLATQIYRLMAEYDTVRGDLRLAQQEQKRLHEERERTKQAMADAARLSAREWKRAEAGPHRGAAHDAVAGAAEQLADDLARRAEDAAVQARAFALLQLKTLDSTKQAIGRYADQQATRRGLVSLPPRTVMAIVGKVLEVMLDPLCPGCQGSGKVGVFPNQQLHTGKGPSFCGGSGRRKVDLASDAVGELFGRWLLSDLERKAANVDHRMRQFLRRYQNEQPDFHAAESDAAVSALQRRLVELRSVEAAVD
jgi:hypothetical protein